MSLLFIHSTAQSENPAGKSKNPWFFKHHVGLNLTAPIGTFAKTHLPGVGTEYFFDCNREKNLLHLAASVGFSHYFGKNEKRNDYSFQYRGFSFLHVMGGTHVLLGDVDLRILAGPAIGIYSGNTRFNIGSKIEAGYMTSRTLQFGPMLNMMWEPGTATLWSIGVKGAFLF